MLTRVEVYGLPVEPLALLFGEGSDDSTIQCLDIKGLEPVRATVNTTPYGSSDGESYFGSSVGKRNIVMLLGLNPDWIDSTYETLRHILYSYFMPKQRVKLKFFTNTIPICEIFGYVESMEPVLFSKDPEVQLSIICPLPDFIESQATVIEGEVKYGEEVNDGILPFDEATLVVYSGSLSTGFSLTLTPTVAVPTYDDPLIIGVVSDGSEIIRFEGVVDATHTLFYSSVPGAKYLRTVSDLGVKNNLLGTVVGDPAWLKFQKGDNLFAVGGTVEGLAWTLEYYNRYVGL